MPRLRVHNFSISLDGYAAGPTQSLDNPLGVGGEVLHAWVFATRTGRRMVGMDGDDGLDDAFLAQGDAGIGATIMGRNMVGPIRGPQAGWAAPRPDRGRTRQAAAAVTASAPASSHAEV
jgi:hypothetical protein